MPNRHHPLLEERPYRALLIVALAAHLLAALFSVGGHHFDEHFQILEFAGLKLGLNQADDLPWEFHERMRSTLQPAMAVLVIRALEATGVQSPFSQVTVLRILSALLSYVGMYLLLQAFWREVRSRELRGWFLFLSLLIWFMPYVHARYSAENWGGMFFWLGVAVLITKTTHGNAMRANRAWPLIAGIVLGFAFVFRFQTGLMLAGLVLWLVVVQRTPWRTLALLHVGIVTAVWVGVAVDRWFYGEWTFAAWNYLRMGLFDANAPDFGISPWWDYIPVVVLRAGPPFSLAIILAMLAVWIGHRRHLVTWVTVPFVLAHFAVGHKELRFLFPLVNILPLVLVLALQMLREAELGPVWRTLLQRARKPVVILFLAGNAILLLIACLKPADNHQYFYKYVYDHYGSRPVLLAYVDEDPYRRVTLDLRFYRPLGLRTVQVSSEDALDSLKSRFGMPVLVASKRFDPEPIIQNCNCTRIYSTLPRWVRNVNVTDWIDRTAVWTLYNCRD